MGYVSEIVGYNKTMTAPTLKEHLQKHKDVIDPAIETIQEVLFGKNRDNGLCADVREIKKGYQDIKAIGIAIIIALITNIVVALVR